MLPKHRRPPNAVALLPLAFAAGLAIVPAARADDTDPPTRVGRIAVLQGTVSFHPSPDDQWAPAELNEPVAQSTALWADTDGEAEVGLGEARIRLASGTELDVVQLDDQNVILSVPQGRVDIAIHGMTNGERYDIQTPRGDVDLLSDGNYRVFAGTDSDPTRVASFAGQAQLVGAASSITVAANQEMVATPATPVAYSIASASQDDLDNRFFQAVAVVYAHPVPAYVPPVPGVEELSTYGTWRDDPQYGHVWVPRQVEAGWQPYRRGHWGFVPPWGYTWIDDAPWGFAPFHYGRWVERGVAIAPGYRPDLCAGAGELHRQSRCAHGRHRWGLRQRRVGAAGSRRAVATVVSAQRHLFAPGEHRQREPDGDHQHHQHNDHQPDVHQPARRSCGAAGCVRRRSPGRPGRVSHYAGGVGEAGRAGSACDDREGAAGTGGGRRRA
jgi:hypothetical protein